MSTSVSAFLSTHIFSAAGVAATKTKGVKLSLTHSLNVSIAGPENLRPQEHRLGAELPAAGILAVNVYAVSCCSTGTRPNSFTLLFYPISCYVDLAASCSSTSVAQQAQLARGTTHSLSGHTNWTLSNGRKCTAV